MPQVGLRMFDAQNRVAVAHLTAGQDDVPFWGMVTAEEVRESFASQTDLTIGVFTTRRFFPPWDGGWDAMGRLVDGVQIPPDEPGEEQKAQIRAEARPILEMNLDVQIHQFIRLMHDRGVIE